MLSMLCVAQYQTGQQLPSRDSLTLSLVMKAEYSQYQVQQQRLFHQHRILSILFSLCLAAAIYQLIL
jgi:hypothetical protein